MSNRVPELLESAAETYRERGKVYGNNMPVHGDVMKALFPGGIRLVTSDDFRRFLLFEMVISKITRYAQQYNNGGHQDSIHDLQVYAAMLEAEDEARSD